MYESERAVWVRGAATAAGAAWLLGASAGCAGPGEPGGSSAGPGSSSASAPVAAGSGEPVVGAAAGWSPRAFHGDRDDVTEPGDASIRRVPAEVLDTSRFVERIRPAEALADEPLSGGDVKGGVVPEPSAPPMPGARRDGDRSDPTTDSVGPQLTTIGPGFFAVDQTPWTPPDPTLAVGPGHVVVTVNQSVAWFDRSGVKQFEQQLNTTATTAGFFDSVGARSFTFDPKVFYDHYEGRFVIVALEVYGLGTPETTDDEAAVTFAISDDDDPNGLWFKYRTDAVTVIGSDEFWWDYPGFGYDEDNIYITGNLFRFSGSGIGGVGIRVIDKASILSGGSALVATSRNPSIFSAQCAQTFGSYPAAYLVSLRTLDSLTVTAVSDPFGSFTITDAVVPIEPLASTGAAFAPGGGFISSIAFRTMNVHLDGSGNLLTALTGGDPANGRNAARWYDLDLNGWPATGAPTVDQSGQLTTPDGQDTYFPAVYRNGAGEIGMVFAASSSVDNVSMQVTGWRPGSAAGTAAAPVEIVRGDGGDGGEDGRWGDYYDVAIDPTDDAMFWAIGQIEQSVGWRTYVQRFTIEEPSVLTAPLAGATLGLNEPTSIAWTAGSGRVFQVQASSDLGATAETFGADFNGATSIGPGFSTSGGTLAWSVEAGTGPDGSDAVVSGPGVPSNFESVLSVTVSGPGELGFDYRVSSEPGGDFLRVRVNGLEVFSASGESAWLSATASLSGGSNLVEFVYDKDASGSAGLDRAEIDNIRVVVDATPWSDVVSQTASGAGSVAWTPATATTDGAVRIRRLSGSGPAGPWLVSGPFTVEPAAPPACPGDTNGDGQVDVTDFFALAGNFGTQSGATLADGDFDGDGDVDVSDFFVLASNFGSSCP